MTAEVYQPWCRTCDMTACTGNHNITGDPPTAGITITIKGLDSGKTKIGQLLSQTCCKAFNVRTGNSRTGDA